MKAVQVASGPASTQASAVAQTPSAMIPSIGEALRLISANSRTIAVEWLGIASGSESDRRASRSWTFILRRRAAASGSLLCPLPARSAPTSLITARHARLTRVNHAAEMLNEQLTRRRGIERLLRIFRLTLLRSPAPIPAGQHRAR